MSQEKLLPDELPDYILDAIMRSLELENEALDAQPEEPHVFSQRYLDKMEKLFQSFSERG